MSDWLQRFEAAELPAPAAPPRPPEPMTALKVDFSFRIYWTKMGRNWSATRRQQVRQAALAITQSDQFNPNLIEKRYQLALDDIPEQTHSGASLVALLEVLAALDAFEESE
jgi:hypothetical protein